LENRETCFKKTCLTKGKDGNDDEAIQGSGKGSMDRCGDNSKGKNLFRESCQHCHGLTGKGDGEMAKYLEPRPSNLAGQATQEKSDKELKDVILKGREGTAMVGFEGAIEKSQLIDLLAYLRSLKF
jgi:mono/diheme cytochrome c family protein